jgi:hypothetical protein
MHNLIGVLLIVSVVGCTAEDGRTEVADRHREAQIEHDIGDASAEIADLRSEIEADHVALYGASGNGNSSGAAVEGFLSNLTSAVRRIDVHLSTPLHMRNRGAGQNMVAVQVYRADGGYLSDGRRSFVELQPGERTRVVFIAFCLDFEKDNPTSEENLILDSSPTGVEPVLQRIASHVRRNPEAEITVPAQAAIWLAQGVSIEHVRERFEVSASEERLANLFLQ